MGQGAALEAKVVEVCTKHKSEHQTERDYRAAIRVGTDYFVKFGNPTDLWPEIETQKYISNCAMSDPAHGVPRIPRVVHSFEYSGTTYLVMEFIRLLPAPEDFIPKITAALVWLASVPAPLNHVLGPLAGGRIRHGFFKDARAPLRFSSVEALERYLGKAYMLLSSTSKQTVHSVKIHSDRLMFSQSDMDASNFGFDEHGNVVLLDFAEVGLLPETFVAHTMSSKKGLAPIAAALGLSDKSNTSMSRISSVVRMAANPKLGLDEHGISKATANKRQIGSF